MQYSTLENISPLSPPWWCRSGHAQTIVAHLVPSSKLKNRGQKIFIPLKDGDRLMAYLQLGKSNLIVVILHGLAGDIESDYMHRTGLLCERLGHTYLLVNHRGAGDGLLFAKKPYHSGRGEDLSDVISFLRTSFPKKKILAIGFSMSGSILLNLLTSRRGSEKPDFAISVNAPIDLLDSALRLKKGLNRIYDHRFVRNLSRTLDAKFAAGLMKKKYHFPFWSTVYDFDQIFTAPEAGFLSREHYYAESSTKNYLLHIDRPTIFLTAADDPFVSIDSYLKCKYSDACKLHIEPHGGHMGYFSRETLSHFGHRWLDYFLEKSLSVLLTY